MTQARRKIRRSKPMTASAVEGAIVQAAFDKGYAKGLEKGRNEERTRFSKIEKDLREHYTRMPPPLDMPMSATSAQLRYIKELERKVNDLNELLGRRSFRGRMALIFGLKPKRRT